MKYSEFQLEVSRLQEASAAYYSDGSSTMSDVEYDTRLADVLRAVEENPGWDIDYLHSVAEGAVTGDTNHLAPMLSLQKVFTYDELRAWHNKMGRSTLTIEPKLDGNAIGLMYHNGLLVKVLTRGDGEKGEDITATAKSLLAVPEFVPMFKGIELVEVRGEAILVKSNFELINNRSGGAYSKARNAVAGIMRGGYDLDYPFINFFAYDVYPTITGSYIQDMTYLAGSEFEITYTNALPGNFDQVIKEIESAGKVIKENLSKVELDGVVLKVVDYRTRDEMGATAKSPRWAIAYKFQPEQTGSTLLDVEWQVGRTGRITPRAVIEPVELGGAIITYATLHNPDFIRENGLRIGEPVLVYRAGEVIPRVIGTGDGVSNIEIPSTCPRCGSGLIDSGVNLQCSSRSTCGLVELLTHAVSRDLLDIDGLGKKQIAKFAAAGYLTDIADIFGLLDVPEEIWSDLSIPYTYNGTPIKVGIEKAKSVPAWKFLAALGIETIGQTVSKQALKDHPDILLYSPSLAESRMAVGTEAKAAKLYDGLIENQHVINKLIGYKVNLTEEAKPASGGPLTGKTVVITGSFTVPRSNIATQVEALGGKVSSSVSKNTDYLIAGENAGSKLDKAKKLGVPVVGLELLDT